MSVVNQAVPDLLPTIFIPSAAIIAIIFGAWLWQRVSQVSMSPGSQNYRSSNGREYLLEEEQRGDDEVPSVAGRLGVRVPA
jgi:inorganic pyrophosphatase